jgi:hypothetical protein
MGRVWEREGARGERGRREGGGHARPGRSRCVFSPRPRPPTGHRGGVPPHTSHTAEWLGVSRILATMQGLSPCGLPGHSFPPLRPPPPRHLPPHFLVVGAQKQKQNALLVLVPVRLEAAVAHGRHARGPAVILLEAEHALEKCQAARLRRRARRRGRAAGRARQVGRAHSPHARTGEVWVVCVCVCVAVCVGLPRSLAFGGGGGVRGRGSGSVFVFCFVREALESGTPLPSLSRSFFRRCTQHATHPRTPKTRRHV